MLADIAGMLAMNMDTRSIKTEQRKALLQIYTYPKLRFTVNRPIADTLSICKWAADRELARSMIQV